MVPHQRLFSSLALVAYTFSGAAFWKPVSVYSRTPPDPKPQAGTESKGATARSSVEIPERPKDILLSAARVNGLGDSLAAPWHIVVDYEVYDEDGDNVSDGRYEEFWASPRQYRLTYTSKDFNQTDIANGDGLYRTGDQAWPGELQTRVRDEFVRPMFREMNLEYGKPEKATRDFGPIKLPCVQLRRTDTHGIVISPNGLAAFCFEPNSLMLRYSKGGMSPVTVWDEIRYQRIVQFQNHYVASEVDVSRGGKKFLEMRLKTLETIPENRLADFTPPENATQIAGKLAPDNRVLLLDYLLHQETPEYPRSSGRTGTASVKFLIGRDGHVTDVQFVDGAPEMKKPLENALPKFVYRPFTVLGQPTEVEVTQSFSYETH